MSNILDEYGKIIVEEILDRQARGISEGVNSGFKNPRNAEISEVFQSLSSSQKKIIIKYMIGNLSSVLFDFLKVFEEYPQFKIIHQEGNLQIDLVEISEMLKAEPIIEGGWIDRFSKEINRENLF